MILSRFYLVLKLRLHKAANLALRYLIRLLLWNNTRYLSLKAILIYTTFIGTLITYILFILLLILLLFFLVLVTWWWLSILYIHLVRLFLILTSLILNLRTHSNACNFRLLLMSRRILALVLSRRLVAWEYIFKRGRSCFRRWLYIAVIQL